jgi:hypothetical protein
MKPTKKPSIERFGEDLRAVFSKNRMVVFLCGPALVTDTPSAKLRARLKDELETDGFEVVLGEDDGLEALRRQFKGIYAHENELAFIRKECGAIVLIADSVGSYCELGLFAHLQTRDDSNRRDFVLIIDSQFEGRPSYLNEGPARAVEDFGVVYYADLEAFDCSKVLRRLQGRRAVYFLDGRGRPAKT